MRLISRKGKRAARGAEIIVFQCLQSQSRLSVPAGADAVLHLTSKAGIAQDGRNLRSQAPTSSEAWLSALHLNVLLISRTGPT